MRRLVVYLTLLALLAVALGAAWIATDWPHWCNAMGWCNGQGLL
jgi:hypothetical protein